MSRDGQRTWCMKNCGRQHLMGEKLMKRTRCLMGASALMSLGFANAVSAHTLSGAPPFPIHHAVRLILPPSHAGGLAFNKSLTGLLTKGGLVNERQSLLLSFGSGPGSLATKSFNQLYRTIVENGVKAGKASVPTFGGGTLSGGTIQGDLYVLNQNGVPGQYLNSGEFTATVGTNVPANFATNGETQIGFSTLTPNFQDSLTFSSQVTSSLVTSHSGGTVIGGFIPSGSGSQRAFANLLKGLTERSVSLGRQIGLSEPNSLFPGGTVSGGLFIGTAYRNSIGSSTFIANSFGNNTTATHSPLYVFAFGNNPLNNPAGFDTIVNISASQGYVLFANGLNKTITNGQVLFPLVGVGANSGSVLTIGSNPANNGTLGSVINNLSSFLFF
jgi:hypothetical protein